MVSGSPIDLRELRVRLDQMTERIVSRLKDRSRFPLNEAVYRADAIPIRGRSGISFLQFSMEGLEAYHASLGRYDYPDQYPVVHREPPRSPVTRVVTQPGVSRQPIQIGEGLIAFYLQVLPRLCPAGDDPNTYGETVYVDADLLTLVNERINVGRYVAEAKAAADPSLHDLRDNPDGIRERLTDLAREEALLRSVEATAARYELDPGVVRTVFRWIIDETLRVEVEYLQGARPEAAR
jgi:monofunctional chorismate mutase